MDPNIRTLNWAPAAPAGCEWGERAWGLRALWELGREGPSMDPNIRTLNWAPGTGRL